MARGSPRPCPGGDAGRGYVSGDGVTSPLGLDVVLPCVGVPVLLCLHPRHQAQGQKRLGKKRGGQELAGGAGGIPEGTRCLAGRREHPFCCQARFPALGNPDRLLLVLGSFCRAAASEEPMGDNKNHHPSQCMPRSRVEAPSPPKPVLTSG